MQLLYKGNYYGRFKRVTKHIQGNRVVELCFADTCVARFCRRNRIEWIGYDINKTFVDRACSLGYNAVCGDVEQLVFAQADTCIICGSFYQFLGAEETLLRKMLASAPNIIISEPVFNLSQRNDNIGRIARRSTAVNNKAHSFRYTEKTILSLLDNFSKKLCFEYEIADTFSKDIIIIITKK